MLSRRQFLAASVVAVAAPAFAIDPVKRPAGPPQMKLSLAAYSFRQALDLKKPTITLFDFIDRAAEYGTDAVELTSYYFAETTDEYLDKLKAHCEKRKQAISCVPLRSDFCQRDEAKRKADIQHVQDWTRRAARLGAPAVRIFAGNLPKGDTLEDGQKRVVASIEACGEVASKVGVKLAMENHSGITSTPEQLLALVKPVTGDYLGVNVDTGNFKTADPYADIAAVVPYGVTVQVKTEVFPGGKKEAADLSRMVEILKAGNYHGYVALEYEAAEEATVAVPRYLKELRQLIG